MSTKMAEPPDSYPAFLAELKQRIRSARLQAALSVNRELVLLYWSIGRDILARQRAEGWGAKVIDRLAADLRRALPEMTGISARNLKYMRAFAEAWPHEEFVQPVVAQMSSSAIASPHAARQRSRSSAATRPPTRGRHEVRETGRPAVRSRTQLWSQSRPAQA